MESFIEFTNQSQGRDRIFRATQYACSLVKYLLRNKDARKEFVIKLQTLESSMSSGRRLFRLGNTLHAISAALRTSHLSDPVARFCLTVANLTRAVYYVCDNVLWAGDIGLVGKINKEHWRLHASSYYFFSLVMNLARDTYVILQIMLHKAQDKECQKEIGQLLNDYREVACVIIPELDAFLLLLFKSLRSNPSIVLDIVKNVCDLFIPLDRLGIFHTNAGVVGFCGLVSSLLGILMIFKPSLGT